MPTRNVNLTEELDQFVLAKVESGRYETKKPAKLSGRCGHWSVRNRRTRQSLLCGRHRRRRYERHCRLRAAFTRSPGWTHSSQNCRGPISPL